MDSAVIGDGLGQILILRFGERDTDRFGPDLGCPEVIGAFVDLATGDAPNERATDQAAVANPRGLGQFTTEPLIGWRKRFGPERGGFHNSGSMP